MQHRILGRTGLELSYIGLGGVKVGKMMGRQAKVFLDYAEALGINYFDTHNRYDDSETHMRSLSAHSIISTKSTLTDIDYAQFFMNYENSFKRLNREVIDIFFISDVDTPEIVKKILDGNILGFLNSEKEKGKIKAIGLTGYIPDYLGSLIETGIIDCVMCRYNIDFAEAEKLIPLIEKHNLGFIVKRAFEDNWLLERYSAEECLNFYKDKKFITSILIGTAVPEHLKADAEIVEKWNC